MSMSLLEKLKKKPVPKEIERPIAIKLDNEQVEVQIEIEDQKFERRDVKIGISDGVNVEIISGVSKDDKIKVWNKTEPIKKGEDDDSSVEMAEN